MAVTTSQQITRYFQDYSQAEVTFTREVIRATLLNTKQIYIKAQGSQWPCILYSSSMTAAKILANLSGSLNEALRNNTNTVQLRFSFLTADKQDSISFFVPAKVSGINPYGEKNKELFFASLQFTQRPPDDLIEIIGRLLEANVNAKRRAEERIELTPHSIQQLAIVPARCTITVEGVPRKVIYRDLSFSGCRAILMGVPKLLQNKETTCRLAFYDPDEVISVPGTIVRFNPVEGREDVAVFGIQYKEESVPVAYKLRINHALKLFRTKNSKEPQAKDE
jgi:Tfp pilus assembly protein PilZ